MPFVIVDTSVWINFFRGALKPEIKEALFSFLRSRQAALTDVILHELLVGARTEKQYIDLKQKLSPLHCFVMEPSLHANFHRFGFELNRKGLLGSYTDVSIAYHSSIAMAPILSFDRYFAILSSKKIVDVITIPH